MVDLKLSDSKFLCTGKTFCKLLKNQPLWSTWTHAVHHNHWMWLKPCVTFEGIVYPPEPGNEPGYHASSQEGLVDYYWYILLCRREVDYIPSLSLSVTTILITTQCLVLVAWNQHFISDLEWRQLTEKRSCRLEQCIGLDFCGRRFFANCWRDVRMKPAVWYGLLE